MLILTYYWPPGAGPGVQRWLKFAKYLPEFGWQPTVITVKNGSYPSIDQSLLGDIPRNIEVIRTPTLEPFALYNFLRGKKGKSVEVGMGNIKGQTSGFARLANYIRANLFIPDARVGWNRYLYPAAARELSSGKYSLVVSTGPPHSTHLVARQLKKQFGIRWIADFRDPWTTIYYNEFLLRTESSRRRDLALETAVLTEADAVVSATPGLTQELESRSQHIVTLFNGYDEEDIPREVVRKHERFTLAYVGNLKANQNVESLWKALAELCREDPSLRSKLRLEITGNMHPTIIETIEQHGLSGLLTTLPFVPHAQAVQRMFDAHLLLLPVPRDKRSKVIMTGKIFEYLATCRPILSIGPPSGNAAEAIRACKRDDMIDYEDTEEMKTLIRKYFERWESGKHIFFEGTEHVQFSRKGITASLSQLMNELVA